MKGHTGHNNENIKGKYIRRRVMQKKHEIGIRIKVLISYKTNDAKYHKINGTNFLTIIKKLSH